MQFPLWQLLQGKFRPSKAPQAATGAECRGQAWATGPSAAARTDLGKYQVGTYTIGKMLLGKMPLGKYLTS